ncbi:MAG: hydrogenase maturation nickel metallochaperone HypA [Actinocatenispora sp.]
MHELAITESVVAAITDRLGDAPVSRVDLEIGRLSGVVSDSVRFCFDLVVAGTSLAGAALLIVETPGRARCRACDAVSTVHDPLPLCPCGSADVEVTGGQELRIRSVEVAEHV